MQAPLIAKREGTDALKVTRDFSGDRPLIWASFTKPALLQRWLLGPPGWRMDRCHIDARTGGRYEWGWRHPQTGAAFGCIGDYITVRPHSLMVDRQSFHQGDPGKPMADATENTVVFHDVAGGTRVITRIIYPDANTRELVLQQNMTAGMEASYQRLDQLLAAMAPVTAAE